MLVTMRLAVCVVLHVPLLCTPVRPPPAQDKGAASLEPWNMGYALAGTTEKEMDPYFPFANAVDVRGLHAVVVCWHRGWLGRWGVIDCMRIPRVLTTCVAVCLATGQTVTAQVWARCFAAMGISYKGATMTLDLCDREGKYSNGTVYDVYNVPWGPCSVLCIVCASTMLV